MAEMAAIAEAQQHLLRARQAQRELHSPMPAAQRQKRLRTARRRSACRSAGRPAHAAGRQRVRQVARRARPGAERPARGTAAARLAPAAADCFNEALRSNRLVRAGACLDARRPGRRSGRRQRRRARQPARAGATLDRDGRPTPRRGEVQGAQAALDAARALDPAAEGLAALAERLRAASGTAERRARQ